MATDKKLKNNGDRESSERDEEESSDDGSSAASADPDAPDDGERKGALVSGATLGTGSVAAFEHDVSAPTQLGTKRFVYAAYFAGAIAIAFLGSKLIDFGWMKLATYKPSIGEPQDEFVTPVAAAIGGLVALYYWKHTKTRRLAEEVADELSKVTWPDKEEVTNSTAVVIITTAVATLFFFLMDRFWGFITNLVYGT